MEDRPLQETVMAHAAAAPSSGIHAATSTPARDLAAGDR